MAQEFLTNARRATGAAPMAVPGRDGAEGESRGAPHERYYSIPGGHTGTLMRHFIAQAGAVTPLARGVLEATQAARLVTAGGGALCPGPGFLRTTPGTVDLAAIAAAANEDLNPAAGADIQARGQKRHRLVSISRRALLDALSRGWDTVPAFVSSTMWRTVPIQTLAGWDRRRACSDGGQPFYPIPLRPVIPRLPILAPAVAAARTRSSDSPVDDNFSC